MTFTFPELLTKLLLGACLLLLTALPAVSQGKVVRQADKAFFRQDYAEAAQLYEQVIRDKSQLHKVNFRLGYSYLKLKQNRKAVHYLQVASSQTSDYEPEITLMIAQGYQQSMVFDSAQTLYEQYKAKLIEDDWEENDIVDKRLQECRYGKLLVTRPVKVDIQNIGSAINSPFSDFVPAVSGDESMMAFTSRREGTTGGQIPNGEQEYFEDIYISYKKDGKWQPATNIGPPVNTATHDACVALSTDGKYLFTYKDVNGGDIYVSERNGSGWSAPTALPKPINSEHFEPSLTLSSDGQYIFFSSNRPEGYGGLDLYVTQKQPDGSWGEAMNLGPSLNTPYDEDAPYLLSDASTLYFSSRGHSSMGGFDIFKSSISSSIAWGTPQNLGYPINTADDDIYITLSEDGVHGFYTSVKQGGLGEKDIYVITFPPVIATDSVLLAMDESLDAPSAIDSAGTASAAINRILWLQGKITDQATGKPLAATLSLTNSVSGSVAQQIRSDSLSGNYKIAIVPGKNYAYTVSRSGYFFQSGKLSADTSAAAPQLKDIKLKPLTVGTTFTLRNIFFDTNKSELKKESGAELKQIKKLLQANPDLRIEIGGHTDSQGPAEYNQQLSERRAKAVVDHLVRNGISAKRLKAVGYGFTKPVATNSTPQGRQSNRRTEFRIIEN